jgi:microcystin-dependent protein
MLSRRKFIAGGLAAPIVVTAPHTLMPIKPIVLSPKPDLLLCDGSTLNPKDYPELFKILGPSYEGAFTLPDLRRRAIDPRKRLLQENGQTRPSNLQLQYHISTHGNDIGTVVLKATENQRT